MQHFTSLRILVPGHWEDADGNVIPVANTVALEAAWDAFFAVNPHVIKTDWSTSDDQTELTRIHDLVTAQERITQQIMKKILVLFGRPRAMFPGVSINKTC